MVRRPDNTAYEWKFGWEVGCTILDRNISSDYSFLSSLVG